VLAMQRPDIPRWSARVRRLRTLARPIKTLGQLRAIPTEVLLNTPKVSKRFVEVLRLLCPEKQ
jgi:hypothetical protein